MAQLVHVSVAPHEPTLPGATKITRAELPPPQAAARRNGVGGPLIPSYTKHPKTTWDKAISNRMLRKDVPGMLSHWPCEEMYAQGNNTPGFPGYIIAYGVANAASFSRHDYITTPTQQLLTLLE